MTPLDWLLAVIAGGIAALVAVYSTYYRKPPSQEITDFPEPLNNSNPTPMPTPTPNAPQTPDLAPTAHKNMLDTFCHGIAQMEGANPANRNPGNCRCSPVGYASMYGNVTCNPHNFAVFPTAELGWMYLENLVHHRVSLHPTWTFVDFFTNYAPSSDGNDPHHYANWMADYCKVPVDTVLAKLFV